AAMRRRCRPLSLTLVRVAGADLRSRTTTIVRAADLLGSSSPGSRLVLLHRLGAVVAATERLEAFRGSRAAVGPREVVVPFDIGAVAAVFVTDDVSVGEDGLGDQGAPDCGGGTPAEALHHLHTFAVVQEAGEERVAGEHPPRNLDGDVADAGDHTDLIA